MGADRHETIQQRAYEIWQREGRPDGQHERHWRQATDELDRDELDAAPSEDRETGRVAKGDVLAEEALAIKTGVSGDEAERLIDKTGGDLESAEQAARAEAARNG